MIYQKKSETLKEQKLDNLWISNIKTDYKFEKT